MHTDALVANPDNPGGAVRDPDRVRLGVAAQRLSCGASADPLRPFGAHRPDVAHICTRHHRHAEMAIGSLRRWVHVLLEKTLASTVADSR